jgi:hypothetical protein
MGSRRILFACGRTAVVVATLCWLLPCVAVAQEAPGEAPVAADSNPYSELRKSEDRLTRQLAERYYNLVKLQEWSSDKGTKITAKYVSHSADSASVTLSVAKGYGAQRVMKDMSVPVSRLSKTCQSRVKQIATIQEKLDEVAAGGGATAGAGPSAEYGAADPGAPMIDERGVEPRPRAERAPAERPARPVTTNSTADDGNPDPLGFGELPPVAAGAAAEFQAPPGNVAVAEFRVAPGADPPDAPAAVRPAAPANVEPQNWRNDYAAFAMNFQPEVMSVLGEWGALKELKAAADGVRKQEADGSAEEEELIVREKMFNEVGEFTWEATLTDADVSSGDWTERLNLPPLPEPFLISFHLDERNPGSFQNLKAGDRVRFVGRFVDYIDPAEFEVVIRFPGN